MFRLLKTPDEVLEVGQALRDAVRSVDPARPTFSAQPLINSADSDVAQPRFGAALMALVGAWA